MMVFTGYSSAQPTVLRYLLHAWPSLAVLLVFPPRFAEAFNILDTNPLLVIS